MAYTKQLSVATNDLVSASYLTQGHVTNSQSNAKRFLGLAVIDSDTAVITGNGKKAIPIPTEINGFEITAVIATVHDKGITGTTDVQVRRRRAGSDVDVLSTVLTIGDEFFASDGTINTSNDDVATGDVLYIDVDGIHSGTAPNGLSVLITVSAA